MIFVPAFAITASLGLAQGPQKAPPAASTVFQKGLDLAQRGECLQALPLLNRALRSLTDKHSIYAAAMAKARCGMSLDDISQAVDALATLNRMFPSDPQVLYVSTHYFSELADRSAHKLASTDPLSRQAMQLEAEALESHGKPEEAIKVYRRILVKYPDAPGIHYRLGRLLLLHQSSAPDASEEAKKEFEEELKVDPHSAATEFMLGDIAWRVQNWVVAAHHFSLATHDDVGFAEAFLGLGMSLNGQGKYAQAIAPLERYVKLEPDNASGHYQLAIAYERTGRKQDADQQLSIQRKILAKAQQNKVGVENSPPSH